MNAASDRFLQRFYHTKIDENLILKAENLKLRLENSRLREQLKECERMHINERKGRVN